MTKWPKNKSKFTVKLVYDKCGKVKATIPKPLIEIFGNPETMTFELTQGQVIVTFEGHRPLSSTEL